MDRLDFTASPDNPYYDYYNYIHEMKLDSEEYFNDKTREEYQLKHNYFISLSQLNFLEWEYEHRSSYLPSFRKKLKDYRIAAIIHWCIFFVLFIPLFLITNYSFAGFNIIISILLTLFFNIPSLLAAIVKTINYLYQAGYSIPKLFAYKGLESINEQKLAYEVQLHFLENEILDMRELSDKLYAMALPYLSPNDRKFMELDAPFEGDTSSIPIQIRIQNLNNQMRQLVERRKILSDDMSATHICQKRQRENSLMSWIIIIFILFVFVFILAPFAPREYSSVFMLLFVIPVLFVGTGKIYDYYTNPYKEKLAQQEQQMLELNNKIDDIVQELSDLEDSLTEDLTED